MKVIVLSGLYPQKNAPNNGIFIHQQMKALKKRGAEVHVIQPVNWYPPLGLHKWHIYWRSGYEARKVMFDEYEGIKIHHPEVFIKMPSRLFHEHPWLNTGKAIAKYIRRNKELKDADILYAQFLLPEGYTGTVVKKMTGMPLASIALGDDVHAWPEEKPAWVPFLKNTLRESDLVLANSRSLARDAEKWIYDEVPVKVETVYGGIDLVKFHPPESREVKKKKREQWDLSPDRKYLLCIATPVVLKGWLELLDAFKRIAERLKEWDLLMVAPPRSSPDALDLVTESEKRGIAGRTRYLGRVDPSDMPGLMQAVDAFVLPSYNEGLANAVLESLASGLPVIATDVGGHREAIEHGVNGFIIPPKDPGALEAALLKVLGDEKFRNNLSAHARQGAERIGSFDKNAELLIDKFNSLIYWS